MDEGLVVYLRLHSPFRAWSVRIVDRTDRIGTAQLSDMRARDIRRSGEGADARVEVDSGDHTRALPVTGREARPKQPSRVSPAPPLLAAPAKARFQYQDFLQTKCVTLAAARGAFLFVQQRSRRRAGAYHTSPGTQRRALAVMLLFISWGRRQASVTADRRRVHDAGASHQPLHCRALFAATESAMRAARKHYSSVSLLTLDASIDGLDRVFF